MSDEEILSAEVVEDWKDANIGRSKLSFLQNKVVLAIALSLIFVSSTLVYIFVEDERIDYGSSISFDEQRTRAYAEDLIGFGHPVWEGRMSGSAEEQATAEYIADLFEELGYQSTLHTYEVPMHSINSEPSLRVCKAGESLIGNVIPCRSADFGQEVTLFNHRSDYVIQGFSGESAFTFADGMEVVHLGEGTDDALWASAEGKIGYVVGGASTSGNTGIMVKAIENGLSSIIRVNKDYNCGKIEGNDCVPIFKGTGIDAMIDANGGTIPSQMAFIAMSKDAGEILEEVMINGSDNNRIEMIIDVTNDQELTVRVPCGTYYGKSSELLIVGGHHDTVYHAQGAVDDTSGTASVLEMATVFSEIIKEKGEPNKSIRFCTWGGEEEGLWGSTAYVEEMKDDLSQNLRLYINLDMNHVDIDPERGDSVSIIANHKEDYEHISNIAEEYKEANPDMASRYNIYVRLFDGVKNAPDGLSCNSDHCPFVFNLDSNEDGRALLCYGSGSFEYHTYMDTMERFNEESLGVSITIFGNYIKYLSW